MKGKYFKTVLITIILWLLITVISVILVQPKKDVNKPQQIIALNEIEQLVKIAVNENDVGNVVDLQTKIKELQKDITASETTIQYHEIIVFISGVLLVAVVLIFGYLYMAIIVPFNKMHAYASQVAKGDLDVSLQYQRTNYFGDLTWAFDHMRKEIIKARASEKEAIENNKTVIATLSHDIKTPIASIRAYGEGLEANLDTNPEKRKKFTNVIMSKCDEVAKLTDDLFLHSLSDLEKLKVSLETVEIVTLLTKTIEELSGQQQDITYTKMLHTAYVKMDQRRFVQVIENIINNARKYAKTVIEISLSQLDSTIIISIRDYGQGILDADMPFIFNKFYRGKNIKQEQGSGLGLYIVKYIMGQMHGEVELINHQRGLEVKLTLDLQKG